MAIKGQSFLKAMLLVAAGAGLSGCVYDVGLGYASDGYYDDAYGCDPYGGYDAYYDCDYGQGFGNIGYGGGWYDNYWYPGYGIFLFDSFGRRYPMREQYRRYWGERRHNWYREHRDRDRDGRGYQGRQRGYTDDSKPRAHGWPDRRDGRAQDGNDDRHERRREDRRDGRRGADDQWRGGRGGGVNAVPMPIPGAVDRGGSGRGQDNGFGRPDRRGDRSADAAPPPPARVQQDSGAEPSSSATPTPRAAPRPRPERPPPPPRRGRDEGDNIRDE